MRLKFAFLFGLVFISPADAITCNLGYYNSGEQCIECEPGYFCASGTRTACVDATNNLYPYSDVGAYDVAWCYLVTLPGKYVDNWRGGMVDCDAAQFCPGNVRVYYGLPDGYRMTKYTTINNSQEIRSDNFNGVNTGIVFKDSDAIDFVFSTTDDTDNRILFVSTYGRSSYDVPYLSMPYIASAGADMYATRDFNATLFPVYNRTEIGDGTRKSVRVDFSNSVSEPIYFGSWTDREWSRTINWYGFKISKSGSVLQNLIPCWRESDNVAGFYDTVGNKFYTNHNAGTVDFTIGDASDKYTCPVGMYYAGRGICRHCPTGLAIPDVIVSSQSIADCGRIMRVGNRKLYLRSVQRTHPSLAVQIGGYTLYGDMTHQQCGYLRADYQGNIYSVCNSGMDN